MALPLVYHWRNLFVRKTTTLLTVLVVASVVGTFAWMFGFTMALSDTLSVAGDERKLVILRGGATSETQSAIPVPDFNKLGQLTEVARDDATGSPLVSPEMLVQVRLGRKSDAGRTTANVAVRGVLNTAFQVHRGVKVVDVGEDLRPRAARPFSFDAGTDQVIVGLAAAKQFSGLELGRPIELGLGRDRVCTITGYFTADGGPLESEIWGYLPSLMNAYDRSVYSSANLLLRDGVEPGPVIAQIEGPAIQLSAQTEQDYWSTQSQRIRTYLDVAYVLVGVMFLAAVIAVAITMFSVVAGRRREVGMLRTLGFSRAAIVSGFLIEAMMLCAIGAVIGCLACAGWLTAFGGTKDMYGTSTFTTLAFDIRLTPLAVLGSLGCVVLVGVIGALAPAWQAAREEIITVLRVA